MVETVFIILCVLFLRPNIKFIDLTCIVLVLHSHGFNDQINTGTDDVGLCAAHTHTRLLCTDFKSDGFIDSLKWFECASVQKNFPLGQKSLGCERFLQNAEAFLVPSIYPSP